MAYCSLKGSKTPRFENRENINFEYMFYFLMNNIKNGHQATQTDIARMIPEYMRPDSVFALFSFYFSLLLRKNVKNKTSHSEIHQR